MQPQSPSHDFDFMLKEQPKPKRSLPLANLSKPVKIGLAVVIGLIVIIVFSSLLSGQNSSKYQAFDGVAARAQETVRVTTLVQQQLQLQDSQTQALAATVNSALSSDKQQVLAYLAQNHASVSTAQLNADVDQSSDSNLQTAAQNNNLDSAYVSYLQDALARYETDLQNAYKTAGPNGQKLLAASSESVQTLLNSAPLKT